MNDTFYEIEETKYSPTVRTKLDFKGNLDEGTLSKERLYV